MPYEIDFDAARGRAIVTWTGSVTVDEPLGCLDDLLSLAEQTARLDTLHDLRDAKWAFSVAESKGLSNKHLEIGTKLGPGKAAYVASDDTTFGMSRMYGAMSDKGLRKMATFRDVSAAREWLGWNGDG